MKTTLEMINRMKSEGVIDKYAIGGAVGATFYLEPSATVDLDIFVMLPFLGASSLLSLAPIYEYLKNRGCIAEGEHIRIGDWPVQFLPVSNALQEEGLTEAVPTEVEGVPTYVMSAEHLAAIALSIGRHKDHSRVLQLLEQGAVNTDKFEHILKKHRLESKWQRFRKIFMENNP